MTINKSLISTFISLSLFALLSAQNAIADETLPEQSLVNQVNQLRTQVSALQAELASLRAIAPYISLETVNDEPTVRFSGVNLQVVNGAGITDSANGTGNLIVGYDEPNTIAEYSRCTVGQDYPSAGTHLNMQTCVDAGGMWLPSFKTGSHYLVVGRYNNYSRWGGVVSGENNTSNNDFAGVSGGAFNIASGRYSTVTAGSSNISSGQYSSVSGGQSNTARGPSSSVSGGDLNTASVVLTSVSGGQSNIASAPRSSVNGGQSNTASGIRSSICGGQSNVASGAYSSVSGGLSNNATGTHSSILGGNAQNASSNYETIPAIQ